MKLLTSLQEGLERRVPPVRSIRMAIGRWGFIGLLVFLLVKLLVHLVINLVILYVRGWQPWQAVLWIEAFVSFSYELVGAYVLRWACHNLLPHIRAITVGIGVSVIALLVFFAQFSDEIGTAYVDMFFILLTGGRK